MKYSNDYDLASLLVMLRGHCGADALIQYDGGSDALAWVETAGEQGPWAVSIYVIGGRKIIGRGVDPSKAIECAIINYPKLFLPKERFYEG